MDNCVADAGSGRGTAVHAVPERISASAVTVPVGLMALSTAIHDVDEVHETPVIVMKKYPDGNGRSDAVHVVPERVLAIGTSPNPPAGSAEPTATQVVAEVHEISVREEPAVPVTSGGMDALQVVSERIQAVWTVFGGTPAYPTATHALVEVHDTALGVSALEFVSPVGDGMVPDPIVHVVPESTQSMASLLALLVVAVVLPPTMTQFPVETQETEAPVPSGT